MKISKLLALLTLSLLPLVAHAQSLEDYATVDSLTVGDTFNYAITLKSNKDYDELVFPDSSAFGNDIEIRSQHHYKKSTYNNSVNYKLQFFGTHDTTLAPIPVLLIQGGDTTKLFTHPLPIKFSSVLSSKKDQSFRPLKPIFEFTSSWWPYIIGIIILIVLAFLIYRYFFSDEQSSKEIKPARPFEPAPFVNPLKELEEKVHALEHKTLETHEDFEEFYIQLGNAIRTYFESLYNIPALESTSYELLNRLQKGATDQDLITETRAVLQEADMVKFANFRPTQKQANRALRKANNFLDRARDIDGRRIQHLRERHKENAEAARSKHEESQKNAGKIS